MVRYVVVGGGVAGVCCAEELCQLCSEDSVTLVSLDRVLKVTAVVTPAPPCHSFQLHVVRLLPTL